MGGVLGENEMKDEQLYIYATRNGMSSDVCYCFLHFLTYNLVGCRNSYIFAA